MIRKIIVLPSLIASRAEKAGSARDRFLRPVYGDSRLLMEIVGKACQNWGAVANAAGSSDGFALACLDREPDQRETSEHNRREHDKVDAVPAQSSEHLA